MGRRQYERSDCLEKCYLGQELEIGIAQITANMGGEVDPVHTFGNPANKKVVWVPYGSRIEMEDGERYIVIKGKKRPWLIYFGGPLMSDRGPNHVDSSIECLLDESGKLHSMWDFRGEIIKIISLKRGFFSSLLGLPQRKVS